MLDTLDTCGCAKCYTLINSGFEKRLMPCVLQAGVIGRQTRTAYVFFDVENSNCAELCSAVLRVFVHRTQMGVRRETVCVRPVLPCGAPIPVKESASFEVSRSFCGWKTADVLTLIRAVKRELGCVPFGLALSVTAPALIVFSAVVNTGPQLMLDWRSISDGGGLHFIQTS